MKLFVHQLILAACRELVKRGITGTAHFRREDRTQIDSIFNIEKAWIRLRLLQVFVCDVYGIILRVSKRPTSIEIGKTSGPAFSKIFNYPAQNDKK
jgi:hypothetical protein